MNFLLQLRVGFVSRQPPARYQSALGNLQSLKLTCSTKVFQQPFSLCVGDYYAWGIIVPTLKSELTQNDARHSTTTAILEKQCYCLATFPVFCRESSRKPHNKAMVALDCLLVQPGERQIPHPFGPQDSMTLNPSQNSILKRSLADYSASGTREISLAYAGTMVTMACP
jgi:hypothetical protein